MEKWKSQPHNLAYQKGVDFCFWPKAAIRGVEILARRTSAFGWKAAIEPDLSGKLHFGDKHRITQIHFPKFPKKNNFVSPKSVFLELIGTINTGGLGAPGFRSPQMQKYGTHFKNRKYEC